MAPHQFRNRCQQESRTMVQARGRANEAITPSILSTRLLTSLPRETRLKTSMTLRWEVGTLVPVPDLPGTSPGSSCFPALIPISLGKRWVLLLHKMICICTTPRFQRGLLQIWILGQGHMRVQYVHTYFAETTLSVKESAPISDLLLHKASSTYGVYGG